MRFDPTQTSNPIDQMRVVGQPITRIDGPLKTAGTARYAYERHDVIADAAYGYPVGASIPKGRILSMDTAAAAAAPGVFGVIAAPDFNDVGKGMFNVAQLFGGSQIQHYHQAIALVVAETFEQARAAAAMITVEYAGEEGAFDLREAFAGFDMDAVEPSTNLGDFEAAFASAPHTVDQEYTTPNQTHAMMEPHATLAYWEGDQVTLWTSNQMITFGKGDLATTLGIDVSQLRMVSPFVGGGFGGKLWLRSDAILAALAARQFGRAVKVALPRPFMANNTTHRSATIQRLRLGATSDGRLQAFSHECFSGNLPGGRGEDGTGQSAWLYAGANRFIVNRKADLDLPEGSDMRAPGEAPGLMALEVAMDELAEAVGIDPVQLRLVNDTLQTPVDPTQQFPSRHLAECLRLGAERFGWSNRNAVPASSREGDWLIGTGMAAGFRGNFVGASGARVMLRTDGSLLVAADQTDIGTGSYTIIAQTAAEMLGLGVDQVAVMLGDSDFPSAWGSGGQAGANSSTSGVYAACVTLRNAIAEKLGFDAAAARFENGTVIFGDRQVPLVEAVADGEITVEDRMEYDRERGNPAHATYAAHFAEVAVHALTGEIRMRRLVAACDAGRILNPITARSQVLGGMVMGIGAALMEELAVDSRRGFFVNHDLAGYEVPVHADMGEMEVIFVGEADPTSSAMKAKGIGELGLCGVSAAIANAVYNATGVRVRSYPITLDKHLSQLPAH
ncbi:molybdopterin cofactor-binding domain-containing protein [Devosia sp. CN2-171]|uniref:molybdopterin cofactor-binding domain-containing protein n=1 Tax=Devosia sp. CN2-171 TaxID=3400909 RepID=UPI003BF844C4